MRPPAAIKFFHVALRRKCLPIPGVGVLTDRIFIRFDFADSKDILRDRNYFI